MGKHTTPQIRVAVPLSGPRLGIGRFGWEQTVGSGEAQLTQYGLGTINKPLSVLYGLHLNPDEIAYAAKPVGAYDTDVLKFLRDTFLTRDVEWLQADPDPRVEQFLVHDLAAKAIELVGLDKATVL